MKNFKKCLIWLLVVLAISVPFKKISAQHSELGARVVLSGAILFGPYYSFWIGDHQEISVSVMAAYEEAFIFPFALNASYNVTFFKSNFQPQIGLQYSYLIAPKKHKSPDDPNGISIVSLMPGVKFQWADKSQNVQSRVWLAYFFGEHKSGKHLIFPIGIDLSYGYKFLK